MCLKVPPIVVLVLSQSVFKKITLCMACDIDIAVSAAMRKQNRASRLSCCGVYITSCMMLLTVVVV